jgi:hypothetical protein
MRDLACGDRLRTVSIRLAVVVLLGASLAPKDAWAQRTTCCSVKIITRASDDPNDLISPLAVGLTTKIGTIDAVTCAGDFCDDPGIVRVPVAPGSYRVRVPTDELDPLGYKVGYISIAPTNNGVVKKCFPNTVPETDPTGREGNVELVVSGADFNPGSLSDYEVGVRLVPLAAPPLNGPPDGEGVTCPAGSAGGGGGGGGGGGSGGEGTKKDRKRPDVTDVVGPWSGPWQNKKLGTSGTASAEVTEPEDGVVQIQTSVIGQLLRCATELVQNPILLRSGTDFTEDPATGNITQVDFTRTNNVFGDVHVEGVGARKMTASAPTSCGGLGPSFEAFGKINKKFTSAAIKFQFTYPDGEKAKASVVVGKQQ